MQGIVTVTIFFRSFSHPLINPSVMQGIVTETIFFRSFSHPLINPSLMQGIVTVTIFFRSFSHPLINPSHGYQCIWLARPVVSWFFPFISGDNKSTSVAWHQLFPAMALFWINDIKYYMPPTSRLCRISMTMLLYTKLLLEYLVSYSIVATNMYF